MAGGLWAARAERDPGRRLALDDWKNLSRWPSGLLGLFKVSDGASSGAVRAGCYRTDLGRLHSVVLRSKRVFGVRSPPVLLRGLGGSRVRVVERRRVGLLVRRRKGSRAAVPQSQEAFSMSLGHSDPSRVRGGESGNRDP